MLSFEYGSIRPERLLMIAIEHLLVSVLHNNMGKDDDGSFTTELDRGNTG